LTNFQGNAKSEFPIFADSRQKLETQILALSILRTYIFLTGTTFSSLSLSSLFTLVVISCHRTLTLMMAPIKEKEMLLAIVFIDLLISFLAFLFSFLYFSFLYLLFYLTSFFVTGFMDKS
jgi:phosphate/sulfate permease